MGWQEDEVVTDQPQESAPWQQDEVVTPAVPPSAAEVAGNAAAKGVASVVDMFGNAPANALNIGKYLAGDTMEKLGHPVWDQLQPTPQPNLAHRGMTALGLIQPEREPQTAGQRILDRAVQAGVGMAASPASGVGQVAKSVALGIVSGAAAGVTKEATGSDLAAVAVGMAVPVVGNKMASTANAPTLANPVKRTTLQEAQAAGYVVNPSAVKPSFTTNKLESVAGKAAVKQEAAIRNQEVTNTLAAKAIGLPEGTPITMHAIDKVRALAGNVYAEVQKLNPATFLTGLNVKTTETRNLIPGPTTGLTVRELKSKSIPGKIIASSILDEQGVPIIKAVIPEVSSKITGIKVGTKSRGQDLPGPLEGLNVTVRETRGVNPLDELKEARAQATQYYKHYDRSADPASLKQAQTFSARANILEHQIEQQAVKIGKPKLIDRLRAARTLIARTYDVERALNLGDGNVSARIIGQMFDKGRPLTGELKVIGKFAQAFPQVARDGAVIPASAVSGTDAAASALLGTVGYGAAGGPAGLVAAGLPLLRSPARSLVLSKGYQSRLLNEPPALNDAMLKSIMGGRAIADSP